MAVTVTPVKDQNPKIRKYTKIDCQIKGGNCTNRIEFRAWLGDSSLEVCKNCLNDNLDNGIAKVK